LSTTPPAFLFDLDGTLYTADGPIPGAVETLAHLRRRGVPFRLVTNTTERCRATVLARLRSYGFAVEDEQLVTPIVAAEAVLAADGVSLVAPFVNEDLLDDFHTVDLAGGTSGRPSKGSPPAVVLGDLGEQWSAALLNEAFRYVMDGSKLIALHKGRYWLGPSGLELDAGAYVAAIEFATGKVATVCGKPQTPFFEAALRRLGFHTPLSESGPVPVMVGDDLWNDVQGARNAGMQGWLVRTGKFREDVLAESAVVPDRVIGSVAEVLEGERERGGGRRK
jgi:HAD superfamily hydrolase (TIGR01458 family)